MINKDKKLFTLTMAIFIILVIAGIIFGLLMMKKTTEQMLSPVEQANQEIRTQISQLLNPTPTIIPDPISIVHEIRSLARLETIQYTVEKIITAEIGQGQFGFLFGDRLLFVAHGYVIAGLDLTTLNENDFQLKDNVLVVALPAPEVFVATLDNQKSYVFDRETGVLTHGDVNLETNARKIAEDEILKSAVEDGILEQAKINGESFLSPLLQKLGFREVLFTYQTDPE